MKQLLFLLLFPCLAMAQYPGNGNQKITLGEQTSADGLVYRGLAADTTRKPSVDTMAFILLDTNTNIIWQYKKATNNAWTRVGGSISSGLTGVLPVANGGTNTSTAFTAGSVVFAGASGTYTQDNSNLFYDNTNKSLLIGVGANIGSGKAGVNSPNVIQANSSGRVFSAIGRASSDLISYLFYKNNADSVMAGFDIRTDRFAINSYNKIGIRFQISEFHNTGVVEKMRLTYEGRLGIGIAAPTEELHVVGDARISGLAATGTRTVLADVNGVLSAPVSSINFKENVQPLNYGLNEILQINPISFDYIDKNKWGEDRNLGFIVEDVFPIIPEVTGALENDAMYLDMTKLIPILTKAIQEQQALIKALEQRILILENK